MSDLQERRLPIRIGFCGASGTGKTTLARWLSKELALPMNPVGSRSVALAMGFNNPYDVDAAGKRGDFQRRLQLEKSDWEMENESFVTDRTFLDELVYTMLHDHKTIDAAYLDTVSRGMRHYTHVFHCPLWSFQDLAGDSSRVNDGPYHKVFEIALFGALKHYPINLYTLNNRTLENRQEDLRYSLRSWLQTSESGR